MVCSGSSTQSIRTRMIQQNYRQKSMRHRLSGQWTSIVAACLAVQLMLVAGPILGEHQHQNQQKPQSQSLINQDHLSSSSQQSANHHQLQVDQQQQLQSAGNGVNSFEQQLVALANQPSSQQMSAQISAIGPQQSGAPMGDSAGSGGSRSRSPRSIGDMFKKFFNGNKRSKGSQGREWDQQQQQAQQQQAAHQQHQHNQAMAATLAAAAANQHAVYASPFAAYTPQSSASALYPQFSPYYSAWPATANLAQALRAPPTLTMAQLTGSSPLYAAASQSYNSYAAPPSPQGAQFPVAAAAAAAAAAATAAGNPQAAASHQHASAVPAPPGMAPHGSGNSALDFHQVLDALVRTSGFAPAGDQEAAAATGYGSKTDGTPVFSFKKLVSLPFYLSTEEKPLDGLANAMGPGGSAGYSLHSMPIMRRHVRRMSAPGASQVQQQQPQLPNLAALQSDTSQMQRSERAQQQHFSNYLNAINNQIASMSTNSQLMQYLSRQQTLPSSASQMDAYAAEAALANYNALASLGGTPPYKTSGIGGGNRNTAAAAANGGSQMQMAASMITPMAVQPPQGLVQHQHHYNNNNNNNHHQKHQYEQEREIQSLLNSMQQQLSSSSSSDPFAAANSPQPFTSSPSSFSNQAQFFTDGHRFGSQQQFYQPQQQQQQHYYWPANGGGQLAATDTTSAVLTINSNGNANNGQDYISSAAAAANGQIGSAATAASLPAHHGHISAYSAAATSQASGQNANGVANHMGVPSSSSSSPSASSPGEHHSHHHHHQQQQVASSGNSQSQSSSTSAAASTLASSGGSQLVSNGVDGVSQSSLGTQQQQQIQPQATGMVASGSQRDSSSSNSNYAQQIEGQQK